MGREATCKCQWAGSSVTVKALLETQEIILRGALLKRVPFQEMKQIAVQDNQLQFKVGDETVALLLEPGVAEKWARAIKNPPSLARKLGITATSTVNIIGRVDDNTLKAAIAEAGQASNKHCTLIIACVDSPASVENALLKSGRDVERGVPIWFVYRKGPGHPLNEAQLRSIALATGIVDTKTAAVSTTLTALRFNRRKAS
jgi:hypothetical protein